MFFKDFVEYVYWDWYIDSYLIKLIVKIKFLGIIFFYWGF